MYITYCNVLEIIAMCFRKYDIWKCSSKRLKRTHTYFVATFDLNVLGTLSSFHGKYTEVRLILWKQSSSM